MAAWHPCDDSKPRPEHHTAYSSHSSHPVDICCSATACDCKGSFDPESIVSFYHRARHTTKTNDATCLLYLYPVPDIGYSGCVFLVCRWLKLGPDSADSPTVVPFTFRAVAGRLLLARSAIIICECAISTVSSTRAWQGIILTCQKKQSVFHVECIITHPLLPSVLTIGSAAWTIGGMIGCLASAHIHQQHDPAAHKVTKRPQCCA